MSTSEIAKLERLWRENRQGFTFAPLAEAYRKMKDTTRALEILSEGMAQRPDYIPASIVLGRCHLDLGDDGQAELAFRHVLKLDSENVIALKALAEISERGGKLADAATHLGALLEVDRSNDDARFHLARLETRIAEGDELPAAGSTGEDIAGMDEPASAAAADGAEAAEAGEPTVEDGAFRSMDDGQEPAVARGEAEVDDSAPVLEDGFTTVSGVEWMGDAPEADADIEVDPSIVLQDHLDVPDDIEAVGGLEVDDVPDISDASADATAMSGLVGQDFDEHSQGVKPLSDLTPGTVSMDEEDVDDFDPVMSEASSDAGTDDEVAANARSDSESAVERGEVSEGQEGLAGIIKSEELELTASEANEFQVASDAESLMSSVSDEEHDAWDSNPDIAAAETSQLETVATSFGADALAPADAEVPDIPDPMDLADEHDVSDEPPVDDEFTEEEADAPRPGFLAKPATAEQDELYSPPEPELVVTESMAELYRRQGHRAEALAVYRLLYQRHPEDLRLREKVDELETEAADDDSTRPPLEQLTAADPTRSVGALLRTLLRARPAGAAGNWPAESAQAESLAAPGSSGDGSPTRPAEDHLSLSDVFGDDTSPIPPAVPAAEESAASGVSFDAFFGNTGTPAPASSRTPSRDDEDLDQFHSWLQNLKR